MLTLKVCVKVICIIVNYKYHIRYLYAVILQYSIFLDQLCYDRNGLASTGFIEKVLL